ncbi:AzlC family ABC transporter permease [Clostridium baratii]|uniref:AzlC family ABC transporter permease n=1 Tax=Clostridium baratii TaxID=1561 RepID=UPI0006BB23C3|nr:AzlC family ABC transporter permease [Clostridium baratii]
MEGLEEREELNEVLESESTNDFKDGFKKGIPIALGYISVSVTFGMIAARGGMNPLMAVMISMTNLTSAGQFAGIDLIFNSATFFEIALITFIINIRYMLMSLSLSQKFKKNITKKEKYIVAFGVTDETFTVASLEEKKLSFKYMLGLIIPPYFGWAIGTFIGAISTSFMGEKLQDSLGIALYGMFIALIVPEMKKSKPILIVVLIAAFISALFKYVKFLNVISEGFVLIIASLVAAVICAKLFPIKED